MALRVDSLGSQITFALDEARKHGFYAIVRLQDKMSDAISITNGTTKSKHRHHVRGMGIQAFLKDGTCAFASTDDLSTEAIQQLCRQLSSTLTSAAKSATKKNKEIFRVLPNQAYEETSVKVPFGKYSLSQQESWLLEIHKRARQLGRTLSITTTFRNCDEHWWIARSDGTSVRYSFPYARIAQTMTKRKKDRTQNVYVMLAGIDASILQNKKELRAYEKKTKKAHGLLNKLLVAPFLPAGHYTALLESGFSGLLAHEAVGHAAESDILSTSVLAKKGKLQRGKKLCSQNISFVDGPMEGLWGDIRYSADGVKRNTVTFIKDGKLHDSLSDVYTAKEIGVQINGAGRSEFYYDPPVPRMSNTRIVDSHPIDISVNPDTMSPKDIAKMLLKIGALKKGEKIVMPVGPMGGEVSPESGTFMFNGAGIYLFEYPNKVTLYGAASFGGNILGALKAPMKGIGKNLILDDVGMCGKDGQGAPVTDGSHPFLLVEKSEAITFGGK